MNNELKQKIITRLGIEDLDEQQQESVLIDIGETILREIVISLLDVIPTEAKQELQDLLAQGDLDALEPFLDKHGVEHNNLVQNASESVLADMSA